MDWDPDFPDRSPLLAPLSGHAAPLRGARAWPAREALQGLVAAAGIRTGGGARLHLVAPGAGQAAYETRIYREGAMQVREGDWHDLFNVLVWLAYPKSKAALNRAHHAAIEAQARGGSGGPANRRVRGRVRDALTVLDESGAIVASSEPELTEDLRAFRWKRLFWERRAQVQRSMRFHVFGHALLEKALNPYVGMTAHAMLVAVGPEFMAAPAAEQMAHLDARVAERIPELASPQLLAPLPLLGAPGWWPGNEQEAFYDDAGYFRPGRGAPRRGRNAKDG